MQTELCDYDIADLVVEACEEKFRCSDLMANTRRKTTVRPRQIAMYAIRHLTSLSYPEIGDFFSKDHTTVLSAVTRVKGDEKLMKRASSIVAFVKRESTGCPQVCAHHEF